MDHAVGTNVSIWSSILNGGATSLPYLQKLNLINVDDTTGEITLADGVVYEHTSDIYALDADGVYRKFGEDVPIVRGARCTVSGGYVTNVYATDALGDPLDPVPQLVYQPARTNLRNPSRALSINTLTALTQDQVGIDGAANSAFLLSDQNASTGLSGTTGGNVVTAGTTCVMKFWMRGITSPITPIISVGLGGGSGALQYQLQFDASDPTTSYEQANTASGQVSVKQVGSWYQVCMQITSVDQNTLSASIYPAGNNGYPRGGVSGAATGTLIVDSVEFYQGRTIAEVEDIGPIFVGGATDRTVIQAPLTAHDNDAGLWYLDAEWTMPETATAQGVISVDGAAEGSVLAYTAASGFIASNDGVTTSAIAASNFVMPGSLKHCIVYSQADNKMRLFMDGALAGTEVAFDGWNLGTVVDLLLSCGYPVKINDLKSYTVRSYDDGIALKDELLA